MANGDIDGKLIGRLAELAALELDGGETQRMAQELSKIVRYVDQLQGVDVEGVTPMTHVHLDRLPLRDDTALPSLQREVALAEAAETQAGGFAVPSFVDEG